MMDSLAMFGLPGYAEFLVVAFVGLLLFGRRLPEVARSLGRSVVEFKKGIKDVKDDVEMASRQPDKIDRSDPAQLTNSERDA